MKILQLTSTHTRPDVRIFFRECVTIAQSGFDVTLVCPEPEWEYPELGVKIVSVPRHRNRFLRMTGTVLSVARVALQSKADIYHLQCPELIPLGLMLRAQGKAVVYDSHEDLPDDVISKGYIPAPLRPFAVLFTKGLVWTVNRFFSGIVAATPTIAEDFDESKTIVLRNLPRLGETPDVAENSYAATGPIMYVGSLTDIRGIAELVKAMEIVGPESGQRLRLLGPFFSTEFENEIRSLSGWEWVDYLGQVRHDEVAASLAEASMGIVTFLDGPNHRRAEPNKLFEYMLAGLPIVASNFDYWRQFVTDPGTGIQVDPSDPAAVAQAILHIINHPQKAAEMGRRGRKLGVESYTWESQEHTLIDLYNQIVKTRRHATRP